MLAKQQLASPGVQPAPWGSTRFRDCRGDYRTETDLESEGQLYAQQANLPMLPVPDLKDTMQKLLKSVLPLCSPAEYERFLRKVEAFLNSQQVCIAVPKIAVCVRALDASLPHLTRPLATCGALSGC